MQLSIHNISKQFSNSIWGLKDFSMEVKPGVLGLLGPNGAGKSTLMSILATITKPTQGSLFWNGENVLRNPKRIRSILGYLPQDFGIYPNLNAVEFLEYIAALKGLDSRTARSRIDELIDLVNLGSARKRSLGKFSGGMKQRVGIAQALLNKPELLIVDEPTAGLDPQERIRFRNLLSNIANEHIVILSTHIVSDIETIATNIALIKNGKLISESTPENLLSSLNGMVWEAEISSQEYEKLKNSTLISSASRCGNSFQTRIISKTAPHQQAKSTNPNLEDVFLFHIAEDHLLKEAHHVL